MKMTLRTFIHEIPLHSLINKLEYAQEKLGTYITKLNKFKKY